MRNKVRLDFFNVLIFPRTSFLQNFLKVNVLNAEADLVKMTCVNGFKTYRIFLFDQIISMLLEYANTLALYILECMFRNTV